MVIVESWRQESAHQTTEHPRPLPAYRHGASQQGKNSRALLLTSGGAAVACPQCYLLTDKKEVCSCGCSTLAAHHHVASSSQTAIGWHLSGSVKKSFSDRTQEPRGVAANWEKDNVGGTRGAVGGLKRWHHLGWERGGAGK
ncbi:UDP-N-acetylmuramoylalanine--D-glutamate ligase [Dissostichus eleginoides]|uniref:UDP-N-acetylmuramoylalanine--D-glutamate ligase n=1 Tax=Dissostichus eleginoides TaxID=100907 RepID=A0AAD9CH50_DISEL|nr:UDP-N-acetylmuramoylalanine--D-glutamate ligase [Dissostichus eleginoides]